MKIINVKGPIIFNEEKWIYDWFEMDSTCPREIIDGIKEANGRSIEVHINSGGGYVTAGTEIYTALKDYPGEVHVKIVGLAGSAASVIAMAGTRVSISPVGQIMIHNVQGGTNGDYNDMRHYGDVLESFNESIANAYVLKTKRSKEELLDLMNKETWFTAQKAKELGFVDEIMFDNANDLVASNGGMLSKNIIEKMKNSKKITNDTKEDELKNTKEEQNTDNLLKEKLHLLNKLAQCTK